MLIKRTRKIVATIAAMAMLLAAWAPSISHALAATHGNSEVWVEICSTTGSRLVKLESNSGLDSDSGNSQPAAMHVANCLYCLTHADTLSLPPGTSLVVPTLNLSSELPPLYFSSPRPLFIWATGQPRAPPAFS